MSKLSLRLAPLGGLLGSVAIWELSSIASGTPTFPRIATVLHSMLSIISEWGFFVSIFETMSIAILGLTLGLIASYAFAIAVTQFEFLDLSSRSTLNFLRSLPIIVLLPLSLVVFGATASTALLLTAFAIFSKIVIFAVDGIRSVESELEDLSKLNVLSVAQKFAFVQVPASAQHVLTGLQLSAARAYGTVILCGLLIGTPGLGKDLNFARTNADFGQMFAYGFLMALIGVALYLALVRLEVSVLRPWGLVR